MASKRIDELMQNASAKEQAAFKESVQTLKDNNVQLKAERYGPQAPARRAEQTRTNEPKLNETVFPNQQGHPQRGGELIQQKRDEAQKFKAPEASRQEKTGPAREPER